MTNYEQFKSDSSILPKSKSKTALATMALTGALLLTPALSDTYTASADSIDTEEISTQSADTLNTDITNSDDATAQSHYNQTNAESVNEYRAENGKSELTQQSDLDEFAKWKIDTFAGEFPTLGDINEFNNAGGNVHEFNGKSVDQQYEDYHGKPAESWLGENLAYSTGYVPEGTVGALDEQTMKQWKNSAPHDANMLNDNYGSIGTAYWSNGDGTYYTVQVFESGERVVQEVQPPTPGGDTNFDNEESQIGDIDDNTDNIGTLDPDEEVTVPGEDDEGSYEIPVESEPTPEPNDPKHPEAPDWVDGNQDVYDDEDGDTSIDSGVVSPDAPEPEVEPEAEVPADDNTQGNDTDDVETPDAPEPTPEPEVEPEPEEETPEAPADEDEAETTPESEAPAEPEPDAPAEPEPNTPDLDDTPESTEDNEESETPDADDESDNTDTPEPEVDESEDVDAGDDNPEPSESDNAESEDADETSDNEDAPSPTEVDDDNAENDSDDSAEAGVTPAPENIESSDANDEAESDTNDSAPVAADEDTKEQLVLTPQIVTEENIALTTDDQPSENTVPEVAKAVVTGVAVTQDENAGASSAFAKDAAVVVSEDAPSVNDAVIDPVDVEVVDAEPIAESGPQTLPDTGIADAGKTTLLGSIAALMGIGAFAMSRRKRSEEK